MAPRKPASSALVGLLGLAVGVAGVVAAAAPATAAVPGVTQKWTVTGAGASHHASPTIADVNGDGVDDIIQAGRAGYVYVKDGYSGNNLPGWPQALWGAGPAQSRPSPSDSAVSVADIDNDGQNELVASFVTDCSIPQVNGGVIAFERNGAVKWKFQPRNRFDFCGGASDGGRPEGVVSTPALGDINGDGVKDAVFGGWDHYLHALDGNTGKELPGFPYDNADTIWGSPALYDTNSDGRMEIFIGTDIAGGGAANGGKFNGFTYKNGLLYSLFKYQQLSETVWSSPSIGDINGDGRLEAVMGTGWYWRQVVGGAAATNASNSIYAFHLDNGSPVPGWPVNTGAKTWGSPALADLNGDGAQEVVLGNSAGKLTAWRGNGTALWQVSGLGPMDHNSPLVADVNGSPGEEVVAATGWGTYVLNGANGANLGHLGDVAHFNAPAIGKTAGGWQIISTSDPSFEGANGTGGSWQMTAYSIPNPTKTPSWPQFRKNARHLGATPTDRASTSQSATSVAYAHDQLVSPNGNVRLWMQGDGNVVATKGVDPYAPFWSVGATGANNRLVTQSDGNIVLYTAAGAPRWATNTSGNPGARLSVQNDGNLVVYSTAGKALWSSGTRVAAPPAPITALASGQCTSAPNQVAQLCMQTDGNLVKYVGGRATWSSVTYGNPGARFQVQGDGNLVVYASNGAAKWASGTSGNSGALLYLQDDSGLRLFASTTTVVWAR